MGQRPAWAPREVGVSIRKVNPEPGCVVIEEDFLDEITQSGILVARPYASNTTYGKVVAINIQDIADHNIFPGDNIVYREYSGGRWSFNGSKVLIVPLDAIIAWFDNEG